MVVDCACRRGSGRPVSRWYRLGIHGEGRGGRLGLGASLRSRSERDRRGAPLGAARDGRVLAALALAFPDPVRPTMLADAVWDGSPPASWTKAIPGAISRLRRAGGPSAIESGPGGYRLAVDVDDIDAYRFESLVSASGRRRRLGSGRGRSSARPRRGRCGGRPVRRPQPSAILPRRRRPSPGSPPFRRGAPRRGAPRRRTSRGGGGPRPTAVRRGTLRRTPNGPARLGVVPQRTTRRRVGRATRHSPTVARRPRAGAGARSRRVRARHPPPRRRPFVPRPTSLLEPGTGRRRARRRSTFVGRSDELAAVLAALRPGAVVTVAGPGGVGKTRLVRHVVDSAAWTR